MVTKERERPRLLRPINKLWAPYRSIRKLVTTERPTIELGLDPRCIGYDGRQHDGGAIITQETDVLDYSSGGTDAITLSKDRIITAIDIIADPYRHDVTTATITPVQDAADKVLSGLTIAGKPTYVSLSSTLAFLKAIAAQNKLTYGGGIMHEDLATAVGADNDSRQAWHLHFGVLNDYDPFDITAGIPAELETTLILNATFATSQLIAATAANGTIDANTDIYAVVYGVQGISRGYQRGMPIPEFRHDHVTSPSTTTTFELQGSRYLKRTTILNLAVAASNNEARNDSNITDITLEFRKPTLTRLVDAMRWQLFKGTLQSQYRGISVDNDGSAAISTTGLDGAVVIDWRRLTHNPYGLNLYGAADGDARIIFNMGTTTGSIHLFNEYYTLPNPAIADRWSAHRPQ